MPSIVSPCPRTVEEICRRLESSGDLCQQAQGHDLRMLLTMTQGCWRDRVKILGIAPGENGALGVLFELNELEGLVYDGHTVASNDCWQGVILVPPSYPYHMPLVRFVGAIPYSPHVLHDKVEVDQRNLTPDMRSFYRAVQRQEAGATCFLSSASWTPLRGQHNLCLVLWLVSGIVCASRFRGESNSLNSRAFAHFHSLAQEGRLPLGPALSYPNEGEALPVAGTMDAVEQVTGEDEDVRWLEDEK